MLDARTILTLLELPKMGRRSVQIVLASSHQPIEHPSDLLQLLQDVRQNAPRVRVPSNTELYEAQSEADRILDGARELGLTVLGPGDSRFPKRVQTIPDPPVVLFVRGDVGALTLPRAVAVIGTREPSSWGRVIGVRLSQRLAERGVAVISGLADGCDTAAHFGCLRGGGKTVAVLAHGLHMIYPASNKKLAAEIIERGGSLVSEYPPGMRAQRSYFVERDRLQSALSDAVLVIETDIEGGTMHTVRACLEQGRILACLSHLQRFANDKSRGNAMLIDRGDAMPIGNSEDLDHLINRLDGKQQATSSSKLAESDTLFTMPISDDEKTGDSEIIN